MDFSSPLLDFDVRSGCVRSECNINPCKNGGKCYDQGNCDCPIQYSGSTCTEGNKFTNESL